MAEVLESREAHYFIIGMVLLDLAIVLTELVLSSFYPTPELAPHLGGWNLFCPAFGLAGCLQCLVSFLVGGEQAALQHREQRVKQHKSARTACPMPPRRSHLPTILPAYLSALCTCLPACSVCIHTSISILPECSHSHILPVTRVSRASVHVVEEGLSYTSIGILAIFNAELVAKLLVFGFKYFIHSK